MLLNHIHGVSFADVGGVSLAYFHSNQIGSARVLSDLAGAITRRNVYTAFGELVWSAGSLSSRYGYVGAEGYEEDPATGFLHVGARYYDPSIGRFLQRDPIGIAGGLNVYSYVDNNPTRNADPSGLVDEGAPPWPGGHNPWLRSPEERRAANRGAAVAAGTIVVGVPTIAAGATAASSAAGAAGVREGVRQFFRWLNRGKFRIGVSHHCGRTYISVRWKNHHWDLFEI